MKRDKIYKGLTWPTDISVEDWNTLVKLKLTKYFIDESIFEESKELLRAEIINYVKLSTRPQYFYLFEWTYDLYSDCINTDKQKTIKILAESFDFISNTDMKWMTNVLTQPDSDDFSERDKISYYFKIIDETLEGVFKPRLKLLAKLASFKSNQIAIDYSGVDLGILVRDFPHQFKSDIRLFFEDPIFSIPTNQWRNIAAHKSFTINKNNIVVEYGRGNIQTFDISYNDFYKIVHWTQDIYRAIRLAQVFINLNYIEEITTENGGTNNIGVRFESSLLHIIHNMQIVGFEFVSTEEQKDTFSLNIKGKINHDVRSSLIHASQCLDQLSCAIYDDNFIRDNFQKTQITIVDDNGNKLASATISIEVALRQVNGEIGLDEYLRNMRFEINNSLASS